MDIDERLTAFARSLDTPLVRTLLVVALIFAAVGIVLTMGLTMPRKS